MGSYLTIAGVNRRYWLVLLTAVALICALLSYLLSYRFYSELDAEKAASTSDFGAQTLRHIISQHQPLLYALSLDPQIAAAAQGRGLAIANRKLEVVAQTAELEAIYLMDRSGDTIAASNYRSELSFVGHNYAFRPYFRDALQGKTGVLFAIGVTTGTPGLFVAVPVLDAEHEVRAVIAAKVNTEQFKQLWQGGESKGFVVNDAGVVILSSDERWLYRSVTPLQPQQLETIRSDRQFDDRRVVPLDWLDQGGSALLDGRRYIHGRHRLEEIGWELHLLRTTAAAKQKASLVAVVVTTSLLALSVLALVIRARRMREALISSEAHRTELQQINQQLEREIGERIQAQEDLASAQMRLIQASRMAALGQLSASVIHELGQPLSAFRNYLAAAEIDPNPQSLPELLQQLNKVARRMQNTTEELRAFARPDLQVCERLDLNRVVQNAVELTLQNAEIRSVNLKIEYASEPAWVEGRQQRLEQVVINLINNAAQALVGRSEGRIEITLSKQADSWLIRVCDNGPGFGGQRPDQLFEAFYTTGTQRNGLGLGLAISTAIVSEHHGTIWAEENPHGGAVFYVSIPFTYQESTE